jgi:hypothetical protein
VSDEKLTCPWCGAALCVVAGGRPRADRVIEMLDAERELAALRWWLTTDCAESWYATKGGKWFARAGIFPTLAEGPTRISAIVALYEKVVK